MTSHNDRYFVDCLSVIVVSWCGQVVKCTSTEVKRKGHQLSCCQSTSLHSHRLSLVACLWEQLPQLPERRLRFEPYVFLNSSSFWTRRRIISVCLPKYTRCARRIRSFEWFVRLTDSIDYTRAYWYSKEVQRRTVCSWLSMMNTRCCTITLHVAAVSRTTCVRAPRGAALCHVNRSVYVPNRW